MTNDVSRETTASERLEVRLPSTLLATLKDAATACGLSLSGYVRDRMTSAAQRDLRKFSEAVAHVVRARAVEK